MEEFHQQAELARDEAKRARGQAAASDDAARRAATEAAATLDRALAAHRSTYPTQLVFAYQFPVGKNPSTSARSSTTRRAPTSRRVPASCPPYYELNESGASLVTFDVRNGTYIVPKVLDRGYLAIGKARFYFKRVR